MGSIGWFIGIFYLVYHYSGFSGVVCIISIAIIAGVIFDKVKQYKTKNKRCEHGIKGAAYNSKLCEKCVTQREEAGARQKQEQEQREKEEAKHKQQKHDAWVARIKQSDYLKQMHPREFEILVGRLMEKTGHVVKITRYTSDHGIDLIIIKDGEKGIVQCKRYKNSVGEPALRDLVGTVVSERANYGIMVTTGKVSRHGRNFIAHSPIKIKIIELDGLLKMIQGNFHESEDVTQKQDFRCPRCNAHMRLINGKYGEFYGCTNYPSCRGTRTVPLSERDVPC
jgi:hypothetical protein